jgi:hypothetical protein
MDPTTQMVATFAPAVLIGFLLSLYRNNILCFWNCNPTGVQIKQYSLMVRNTVLDLINNITTSKEVMQQIIHNTILTLARTINEMLLTIYQTFYTTYNQFCDQVSLFAHTVKNQSYALVESVFGKQVESMFPTEQMFMIGMYALVGVSVYYLLQQKDTPDDKDSEQKKVQFVDMPPAFELEKEEKKAPVRRRTRRT